MSKPSLSSNLRGMNPKKTEEKSSKPGLLQQLAKPLPVDLATILAQANLELRISYLVGGGTSITIYRDGQYVGTGNDLDRFRTMGRFARAENRRIIADAEIEPVKELILNAVKAEKPDDIVDIKVSTETVARAKQVRATLATIRANESMLNQLQPTNQDEKDLVLKCCHKIYNFVVENFVAFLKGHDANKEAQSAHLFRELIPKWVFTKFSSKLEKPSDAKYNFAKLFFPRSYRRNFSLTLEEIQCNKICQEYAIFLDGAQGLLRLCRNSEFVLELIGEAANCFEEMSDQNLTRFKTWKVIMPQSVSRMKHHAEDFAVRTRLDVPTILRGTEGFDRLINLANCFYNISTVHFPFESALSAMKSIIFPDFYAIIKDLAPLNARDKIRTQIKSKQEVFDIKNLSTAGIQIELCLAGLGIPSSAPIYKRGMDLALQKAKIDGKEVVDYVGNIFRHQPPDPKAPKVEKIDLNKSIDPRLKTSLVFPSKKKEKPMSGQILTALTKTSKAFLEDLHSTNLKHLKDSLELYLKGFETEAIQSLAAKRLLANLDDFIKEEVDDGASNNEASECED